MHDFCYAAFGYIQPQLFYFTILIIMVMFSY